MNNQTPTFLPIPPPSPPPLPHSHPSSPPFLYPLTSSSHTRAKLLLWAERPKEKLTNPKKTFKILQLQLNKTALKEKKVFFKDFFVYF